jgi:hypothetical protein
MFTKDLDTAAGAVRALVGDLDPDAIPLCEVLAAWKLFNAIERDAASAKTLLARRVEDGNTWRSAGYRSRQLASLAGSSVTTEKKSIEASKRVKKSPKTANAMRKGKLSPAKAEAIAGAAAVAPGAEDKLLAGAEQKPLGELREECLKAKARGGCRQGAGADPSGSLRPGLHGRRRRLEHLRAGAGRSRCRVHGRLGPLIDEQFKLARAEGREEPLAAYAFDALMKLADLAGAPAEPVVTEPAADGPTMTEPVKSQSRSRSRSRSRRPPGISS